MLLLHLFQPDAQGVSEVETPRTGHEIGAPDKVRPKRTKTEVGTMRNWAVEGCRVSESTSIYNSTSDPRVAMPWNCVPSIIWSVCCFEGWHW